MGKMDRWDGKHVRVKNDVTHRTGKEVEIRLKLTGASRLALALKRLHNVEGAGLAPELEELMWGLDFVLVGDPASVARHRRMEAGKGMEPGPADPASYDVGEAERPMSLLDFSKPMGPDGVK